MKAWEINVDRCSRTCSKNSLLRFVMHNCDARCNDPLLSKTYNLLEHEEVSGK